MAQNKMTEEIIETTDDDGPDYASARYWTRRAKETEEIFKNKFWKAAKEAWAEYELSESESEASEAGTGAKVTYAKLFPIFWSSIKTLRPAYYSRTPIPIAPTRYGLQDVVARTGSVLLERLGKYALEVTEFDEVMRDTTLEFIISDVATARVMLDGDETARSIPIFKAENGQYVTQNGQLYEGENIGQDEDSGAWYGEEKYWENKKCYPVALSFDDFMWTAEATSKETIEEEYFRFCYSEQEAYAEFTEVDRDTLRGSMRGYGKKEENQGKFNSEGDTELFLHGWEIWHKKTKTIIFISDDYKNPDDKPLKLTEDRYKLKDFFPAPCPIVGTKKRKSLFGIPSYRYLKPMCDHMHEIGMRIYKLTASIRRRFIADKAHQNDLINLIEDAEESEYIFIKGLMDIVEKGGIQNLIQVLPVGELAQSIVELANIHEKYKQEFYEIYGIPDVIRGASDPLETAKAQEIKSFSATNRFRDQMNQVAKFSRDLLELLLDLKLGAYTVEEIHKICAVRYMDMEDQQRFSAAYSLITNDDERIIRIDIETDSTSYINEQIEQQNRNVAISTVMGGLQAIREMGPKEKAIGFKTIQSALSGMRLGKDYMDDIDRLIASIMEEAKQPPATPPPDYERLKLEIQANKNQIDSVLASRKLDQQERQMNTENYFKKMDVVISSKEMEIEQFKVGLLQQKQTMEGQFEAVRLNIEDITSKFMMAMEQSRLSIEEFKAVQQAMESQKEEIRLARDSNLSLIRAAADIKAQLQPAVINVPEAKPAQIELRLPERKKRRQVITPVEDGMGSTRYFVEDIEEG